MVTRLLIQSAEQVLSVWRRIPRRRRHILEAETRICRTYQLEFNYSALQSHLRLSCGLNCFRIRNVFKVTDWIAFIVKSYTLFRLYHFNLRKQLATGIEARRTSKPKNDISTIVDRRTVLVSGVVCTFIHPSSRTDIERTILGEARGIYFIVIIILCHFLRYCFSFAFQNFALTSKAKP